MSKNNFYGHGQINMDSQFGIQLFNIASSNDCINIIETGTWNGQGSTVCIMNGIINKNNSILYSIEACDNQFNNAIDFWKTKNTKNKLCLLNGTLHKNIPDFEETNNLFVRAWYDGEKKCIENSKLLNIDYIENIDFIVIDGGEYTAQGDFDVLIKKNPKYIALDDTKCYKCRHIRENLLKLDEWNLYAENQNDRNGWSIFKRI